MHMLSLLTPSKPSICRNEVMRYPQLMLIGYQLVSVNANRISAPTPGCRDNSPGCTDRLHAPF